MPRVGDVTLMDESFDRFLTMAEQGATTVYSVAGVTFRMDALRSITADGAVTIEPGRDGRTTREGRLTHRWEGMGADDWHMGIASWVLYVSDGAMPTTHCEYTPACALPSVPWHRPCSDGRTPPARALGLV